MKVNGTAVFQDHEFLLSIADGKMVNLNSVYEISGRPKGREPKEWNKLESTKKLIKSMNGGKTPVLKSKRGAGGGTWAHWQLALSYAQYLSPELHVVVNGVFKERLEEMVDPELGITRSQERARKSWRSQGKTEDWIAKREQGKEIRDAYVSTLINHDVKPGQEVGHCTNQIYKGLFDRSSSEIEDKLRSNFPDLPKKINIRDHAKLTSLAAIGLAEALSSEKIEEIKVKGVEHCAKVSLEKATSVRAVLTESRNKDKALSPPIKNKGHRNKEKNMLHVKNLRAAIKGNST